MCNFRNEKIDYILHRKSFWINGTVKSVLYSCAFNDRRLTTLVAIGESKKEALLNFYSYFKDTSK